MVKKRLSGEERAAVQKTVRDAYESGASIRDCADLCGFSYGGTRRLLIEAGVELRAHSRVLRGLRGAEREQVRTEIREAYERTGTLRGTAAETGYSIGVLRRYLHEAGLLKLNIPGQRRASH